MSAFQKQNGPKDQDIENLESQLEIFFAFER